MFPPFCLRLAAILALFGLAACGAQEPSGSAQSSSRSVASMSSAPSSISAVSSSSMSSSTSSPREAWMINPSAQFEPAIMENGVRLTDDQGNTLHAHGAGMIKVGDMYYWYGENRYDADQSFKSVRLYSSKNLRDWHFVKDILTDTSDSDLNFAKIERPKIIHNPATGKYIMWMHKEGGDNYGQARAAVAVADRIDGDYQYLGSFRPLNYMSRDCTAFVDDDGSAYFLSAANENADLHLYRLTRDFTQIESLVQKIWVGQKREAPALVKRNGVYYLITSGTSGWDPNQALYGTATQLGRSWSATKSIGNGTTFDSQPTFILPIEGSVTTSYLYMGDRWLDPAYKDSKYVWLPLQFGADNSLSLDWSTRIAVDASTGELFGSGVEEVRIQSQYSGKCLDVADESLAERANIVQWACSDRFNQRWRFSELEPGYWQIKALHSSNCLDVASGSAEDGANVLQYPCNGEDNQLWRRQQNSDGSFRLISKHSGRCLDLTKWSNEDGGNIQQWECMGTENQNWLQF